jgi:hypothetical protein
VARTAPARSSSLRRRRKRVDSSRRASYSITE